MPPVTQASNACSSVALSDDAGGGGMGVVGLFTRASASCPMLRFGSVLDGRGRSSYVTSAPGTPAIGGFMGQEGQRVLRVPSTSAGSGPHPPEPPLAGGGVAGGIIAGGGVVVVPVPVPVPPPGPGSAPAPGPGTGLVPVRDGGAPPGAAGPSPKLP